MGRVFGYALVAPLTVLAFLGGAELTDARSLALSGAAKLTDARLSARNIELAQADGNAEDTGAAGGQTEDSGGLTAEQIKALQKKQDEWCNIPFDVYAQEFISRGEKVPARYDCPNG